MTGTLALVGGGEWTDGCTFDAALLAASGGSEVVVLPTAAAFEQPDKAVATATSWFEALGGTVRGLHVLNRRDALDPSNVDAVRAARFIYLSGGSPLHLRSVIKETPLWEALDDAWHGGAVVAGSSAGAMVLGDPMIDPRGGAFT
ncbi:MAG TPA: Type 1 glutamine amidotransferase-like domain-containing protein, partial [Acidimicrobiales bacterium]|nr:Type 1 glutamine amidotransferase-like domain-containing protein [Acidimicrobiales bacterium]